MRFLDSDGRGAKPASPLVALTVMKDWTFSEVIVKSVNYSIGQLEQDIRAGLYRHAARSDYPWTKLIGLAGEAVTIDYINSRGTAWASTCPAFKVTKGEGAAQVVESLLPDVMSGPITVVTRRLEGVLAGPNGPDVTVITEAPKFLAVYEVKTSLSSGAAYTTYLEGALKVGSAGRWLYRVGTVYVLVVDRQMWHNLSPSQRQNLFAIVHRGSGFVFLLDVLNDQAIRRAEKLVQEVSRVIGGGS